jgi:hypothetical protein
METLEVRHTGQPTGTLSGPLVKLPSRGISLACQTPLLT